MEMAVIMENSLGKRDNEMSIAGNYRMITPSKNVMEARTVKNDSGVVIWSRYWIIKRQ